MLPQDIYRKFGFSVGHLVFSNANERISSGTGFLINGFLVTCAHVVDQMSTVPLQVRFPNSEVGQTPMWDIPGGVASLSMRGYSSENSYDYAILEPPAGVVLGVSLEFSQNEPAVGDEVCGLGYPFEHEDLTLSTGRISAKINSGVARLLKLDMSINPSNSGGPLIGKDSGLLVGMISRKATGLSKQFNDLMDSFDQNIAALAPSMGLLGLGEIDPISALTSSQTQMKRVAMELKRSAQVGIGWAVYVDPLRSEVVLGTY